MIAQRVGVRIFWWSMAIMHLSYVLILITKHPKFLWHHAIFTRLWFAINGPIALSIGVGLSALILLKKSQTNESWLWLHWATLSWGSLGLLALIFFFGQVWSGFLLIPLAYGFLLSPSN